MRLHIEARNGTIIDGHNRWKIIQKHPEIPYRIKEIDFADKWSVIDWMCRNQLGRRNLTEAQRKYLIQQAHDARKKLVPNASGTNRYSRTLVAGQNDQQLELKPRENITRKLLAKEQRITEMAVRRAVEFGRGLEAADKVSPGFKELILNGDIKVPNKTIADIRKMEPKSKDPVFLPGLLFVCEISVQAQFAVLILD